MSVHSIDSRWVTPHLLWFFFFTFFFLFPACGYWWDVRVVTGNDFRVEALRSVRTLAAYMTMLGSMRNERIQMGGSCECFTCWKINRDLWVVTSLAQSIPQDVHLGVFFFFAVVQCSWCWREGKITAVSLTSGKQNRWLKRSRGRALNVRWFQNKTGGGWWHVPSLSV